MENEVLVALIVAGGTLLGVLIGALTQPLFQFLSKFQDEKIDNRKWNRDIKFKEYEKKKQLYIDTLWLLREIQIGFEFEVGIDFQSDSVIKSIKEVDARARLFLPELMLVSSLDIYDTFTELLKYQKFSYTSPTDMKLFEESKIEFSNLRLKLARLMQSDLDIKHKQSLFKNKKCEKCGAKLKGNAECPKCKHMNTFAQQKVHIDIE